MKLSILCIVNNRKIYDEFLENLAGQSFKDFELITIENMHGEYAGARSAFNENALKAKGKFLMFIHPDVRFLDENALKDMVDQFDSEVPFGMLGAAGAVPDGKGGREIVTTLVHGEEKNSVGRSLESAEDVQTLDECLMVVENEYFRKNPFSKRKGWHLYGAEYCLEAIKNGRVNKAIPSRIWHMSDGKSLDESYMMQLEQLIEDEKDHFDLICTTVKAWKTKGKSAAAYRKYYYLKQLAKRKIIK